MKYKADELLEEAYAKVLENKQLEEGIVDRVKGALAGVKRAGSDAWENKGEIGNAIKSGVKGNFSDIKDVAKNTKTQFKRGQTQEVLKSHVAKMNHAIDDFIEDMKKIGKLTPDSIANYQQTSAFLKGIIKNIAKASGRGTYSVTDLKSSLGRAGFLHPKQPNDFEE